jgi:hypothetical protein
MKLIELLARELKEWPEGWFAAAQDDNGLVSGFTTDDITYVKGTGWNNSVDTAYIALSRDVIGPNARVDDYDTATVTRAEWEAAVSRAVEDTAPFVEPTTTLETMLTEWRDLEARAQATQAEADALFEHAGQCHGEIVVRLAELGWGAPRMVPGEPVVTLDDNDGWIEWKGGACPVPKDTLLDIKYRAAAQLKGVNAGDYTNVDWTHTAHRRDIVAYRLTPSTQP